MEEKKKRVRGKKKIALEETFEKKKERKRTQQGECSGCEKTLTTTKDKADSHTKKRGKKTREGGKMVSKKEELIPREF